MARRKPKSRRISVPAPGGLNHPEWQDFKRNVRQGAGMFEGEREMHFNGIMEGMASTLAEGSANLAEAVDKMRDVRAGIERAIPGWTTAGNRVSGLDAMGAEFLGRELDAIFEHGDTVLRQCMGVRANVADVMEEEDVMAGVDVRTLGEMLAKEFPTPEDFREAALGENLRKHYRIVDLNPGEAPRGHRVRFHVPNKFYKKMHRKLQEIGLHAVETPGEFAHFPNDFYKAVGIVDDLEEGTPVQVYMDKTGAFYFMTYIGTKKREGGVPNDYHTFAFMELNDLTWEGHVQRDYEQSYALGGVYFHFPKGKEDPIDWEDDTTYLAANIRGLLGSAHAAGEKPEHFDLQLAGAEAWEAKAVVGTMTYPDGRVVEIIAVDEPQVNERGRLEITEIIVREVEVEKLAPSMEIPHVEEPFWEQLLEGEITDKVPLETPIGYIRDPFGWPAVEIFVAERPNGERCLEMRKMFAGNALTRGDLYEKHNGRYCSPEHLPAYIERLSKFASVSALEKPEDIPKDELEARIPGLRFLEPSAEMAESPGQKVIAVLHDDCHIAGQVYILKDEHAPCFALRVVAAHNRTIDSFVKEFLTSKLSMIRNLSHAAILARRLLVALRSGGLFSTNHDELIGSPNSLIFDKRDGATSPATPKYRFVLMPGMTTLWDLDDKTAQGPASVFDHSFDALVEALGDVNDGECSLDKLMQCQTGSTGDGIKRGWLEFPRATGRMMVVEQEDGTWSIEKTTDYHGTGPNEENLAELRLPSRDVAKAMAMKMLFDMEIAGKGHYRLDLPVPPKTEDDF
jgi:hypothetical protein